MLAYARRGRHRHIGDRITCQPTRPYRRTEAGTKGAMQEMQGALGQSFLKPRIKAFNIGRGKPLQFEAAYHRQNIHSKQLGIAFL